MRNRSVISLMSSIVSILIGMVFGFILLVVFNPGASLHGMLNLVTTGFSSAEKFAKVLYTAAPLLMTGLAVGFAFKTGLFNIGASGQYTIGAFCALMGAIQFELPWYVCILLAMIGGAIWGSIPGIFKAFFNVNEVITSIMFNWIGLFAVNFAINNMPKMLANYWGAPYNNKTAALALANPSSIMPRLGLDKLMGSNYMNIGIFIAIIIAIIVYIVLNRTTFGYELKACGLNRNASEYAGINARRNIVISMLIAGALAGIGGALYYLSGTGQYAVEKTLLGMGFNGIPVALLASSNPVGTIFSALFVSYIQIGGDALQPEFAKETIDIIIAVIIYLSAFSLMIKGIIGRLVSKKEKEGADK